MKKIRVDLKERSYDILLGAGIIKSFPSILAERKITRPLVVIADNNFLLKNENAIKEIFREVPNKVYWIKIPGKESSKKLDMYGKIVNEISSKGIMGAPVIIALGGGVTGDLAGFIAATYRRGVPFIQIPTTLLALVDSSVGGKVGIDLEIAKNLLGSFKQPDLVIADINFLKTLPARQIRNGLAEVIKYGVIKNAELFKYLERNVDKILAVDKKALERIVYECVNIKARVVEKDELDKLDIRIILNFGHTFGHAIESASGYGTLYNHGEGVAIGMVMAAHMAVKLGEFNKNDFFRLKDLLEKYGLPTRAKNIEREKMLESYKLDKKFIQGVNRFILPEKIGKVKVVENIPVKLIMETIEEYIGK
ncbi:3-dehydroquinate synthase [Candidatus Omnitrophus magneticus]|uniref:3-dehydroquinate synthase n=1 Tax=Candidatus Omnitrophus magneticus TaxID=1609969 RepID=A0A0F0CVC0_9BACT|nr:3-dehydroquinate synthase [Candidatus Omnitrophus magneticus]